MLENVLDIHSFDSDDEKVLHDMDRRLRLPNHLYDCQPYNCIGVVQTTNDGQRVTATGFLLSSCLVLTAAHTFYFYRKKIDQILEQAPLVFYLGINGYLDEQKSCRVISYRICPQYRRLVQKIQDLRVEEARIKKKTSSNFQNQEKRLNQINQKVYEVKKQVEKYDYALLKIQRIIQKKKYLKIVPINRNQTAQDITVCGYSNIGTNYYLHSHSDSIQLTTTGCLYDIDTLPGQSGCPIWLNDSVGKIIGMHKGYDKRQNLNTGVVFTRQIMSQIYQWSKDMRLDNVYYNPSNSIIQGGFNSHPSRNSIESESQIEIFNLSKMLESKQQKILHLKKQLAEEVEEKMYFSQQFSSLEQDIKTERKYFEQNRQQLQSSLKKEVQQKLYLTQENLSLKQQLRMERKKQKNQRSSSLNKMGATMANNFLVLEPIKNKRHDAYLKHACNERIKKQNEIESINQTFSSCLDSPIYLKNKYSKYFSVSNQEKTTIITRVGLDTPTTYSFIKKQPIPQNKITTLILSQKQTKFKSIRYGICTQSISGKMSGYISKEAITYHSQDGKFCKEDKYYQKGRPVQDGEVIQIKVNRIQNKIKWQAKNGELAQTSLTNQMREKQLYFVIMMRDVNDKVQLL